MTEFDGARGAKAASRERLYHALAGTPDPEPDSEPDAPPRAASFDGGARQNQPGVVPSHGETIMALLETRTARVAEFPD